MIDIIALVMWHKVRIQTHFYLKWAVTTHTTPFLFSQKHT